MAKDATALQVVANARAQMNSLEVPLSAVSYAAQIGISEPVLDTLLHPAVPFSKQLAQGTATIAGFPTFSSTPTLRADVAELQAMIPKVAAKTVSFDDVHVFLTKMASDIDNVWYHDYNRLQADVAVVAAAGDLRGARVGPAPDLPGLPGRRSRDRGCDLRPRGHRAGRLQAGADPGRRRVPDRHRRVHRPAEPEGPAGVAAPPDRSRRTRRFAATIQQGLDRRPHRREAALHRQRHLRRARR